MRPRTLTKDQLTEGDIVYLGRRLGDEPKQKKVYHNNRSLFDDDHDSDDYDYLSDHWDVLQVYEDYDSRSEHVSEETIAYYESIDVDRRITNHFGVIINLNKGKDCDETKVFVCMITSGEGTKLTDCIGKSIHSPYLLPIHPRSPTIYHPQLLLRLEHDRGSKKFAYVDYKPRPFRVWLLETCKSASPHGIGYYRLDQESIEILKVKIGYTLPAGCIDTHAYPSPGAGALHQTTVGTEAAQSTHGKTEQSREREAAEDTTKEGGGVKCCTNFVQLLRMICGTSVPWHKPGTSLTSILFSTLKEHAPNSSVRHPLIPFVVVDMKLYQATTNMPCRFIPFGQSRGMRRIETTKTRTILSIGVLINCHSVSKREQVHGNNEVNRNGARRILGRLLLCEGREGLNLELFSTYVTEQSWKELTQKWDSPDAWWEGHPLDEDHVPRPATSDSSSSRSLLQPGNHISGPGVILPTSP